MTPGRSGPLAVFLVVFLVLAGCSALTTSPLLGPSTLNEADDAFSKVSATAEELAIRSKGLREAGMISDETWNDVIKPALRVLRAGILASEAALNEGRGDDALREVVALRGSLAVLRAVLNEFAIPEVDESATKTRFVPATEIPLWTLSRS